MLKLYKELKRRNVIKTIGVYGAAVIVIIQLVASAFPYLGLPAQAVTFVIVLAILGFPITFFLSWTYDLKKEIKTDGDSGHGELETNKKYSNKLLPLTGFLTIVGGAFWFWYSLGNITTGSDVDLQMGIKKSIAVIKIDNLTGKDELDQICSAITQHIYYVLTGFGKLDVKSRSAVVNQKISDLNLDYYIEGKLTEIGGRRNIDVSIVNAKSESSLWTRRFNFNDQEIFSSQDTIIQSILTELDIDTFENEFISNNAEYGNVENFKLIGEGILNFDKKNYAAAIKAFNLVLASDPENIMALYHKANSFYKLNKFTDAMNIYKRILDPSTDTDHIDWRWRIPKNENINRALCTKMELIKKDLAVMLLREEKRCWLMGFNPVTQEIKWEIPIDDVLIDAPVIINNTIFLTSNRIAQKDKGAPTIYAFDINGRALFIKDFERDNNEQSVFINIIEEYSNISNDASNILLSFNKIQGNSTTYMELAAINTKTEKTSWTSEKIKLSFRSNTEIMLINTANTELLLLLLNEDIVALNNKTGEKVWHNNFPNSLITKSYNQKILVYNRTEKNGTIWDPILRMEEYKIPHKNDMIDYAIMPRNEFQQRMDNDIILGNFINGDLSALNFEGGLFDWNRKRWNQNIGIAEKIWFKENIYNRVFCLTENDTLFTINLKSGKIINRLATDRHDYSVYYDNSQNAMVLNNAEFLIGIDPINGEQLWKIRTKKADKIELVENTVLAIIPVVEDSILLINIYNRDNGNLIWPEKIDISKSLSTLSVVAPMCGLNKCDYCDGFTTYLQQYSDQSLLLNLHDEIIKVDIKEYKISAVQQNDVLLQIAKTYEKNGQLDKAINEYKILTQRDQMNQESYWGLANIYQQKKQVNEAAQSLVGYYELILPESTEGIKTVNKLRSLNVLKWELDVYWEEFSNTIMAVDNEKIFLFLDNNIETYRINSGALNWKSSFGDKNTSIVTTDFSHNKHIYYIKKNVPDVTSFYYKEKLSGKTKDLDAFKKASKYRLVAMDKRNAKITLDVPIDIPGESEVIWMGVKNNKIFIQSMVQNKMSVSVYDIIVGDLLWEISHDVSSFYTSNDLKPAFYNGNLLLPLDSSIKYIDESGNTIEVYNDEEWVNIYFFNENSIQNNTMIFIIDDFGYEYVRVDLDKFTKMDGGSIDIENLNQIYLMKNIFIEVSSSGTIRAYNFNLDNDNAELVWDYDFNSSLKTISVNNNFIYLLDSDNNYIIEVDAQKGKIIKNTPLLWSGENVEISNNYFIVQSANKLYLISI